MMDDKAVKSVLPQGFGSWLQAHLAQHQAVPWVHTDIHMYIRIQEYMM